MIKFVTIFFISFLGMLQYDFWFGSHGIVKMLDLNVIYNEQVILNQELSRENHDLYSDIINLKNSDLLVEEIARQDLGYIKPKESFFQIK